MKTSLQNRITCDITCISAMHTALLHVRNAYSTRKTLSGNEIRFVFQSGKFRMASVPGMQSRAKLSTQDQSLLSDASSQAQTVASKSASVGEIKKSRVQPLLNHHLNPMLHISPLLPSLTRLLVLLEVRYCGGFKLDEKKS